jgi:hypothetical protein
MEKSHFGQTRSLIVNGHQVSLWMDNKSHFGRETNLISHEQISFWTDMKSYCGWTTSYMLDSQIAVEKVHHKSVTVSFHWKTRLKITKPTNIGCCSHLSIFWSAKKNVCVHFGSIWGLGLWCLEPFYKNISVISWRSVLLVKETSVPGKNHQPGESHWQNFIT